MLDTKARGTLSREDLISHHLRVMALVVDPPRGQLINLADDIGVHAATLSAWIAQGYIPYFQCKKLLKRFGKKLVLLDELCPEEFRNN